MEKQYLVISEQVEEKEISFWWENEFLHSYSAEIFGDFAEAKKFMREQIVKMLADSWESIILQIFGEDDGECEEGFDELYEKFPLLFGAFGNSIDSVTEKIKKLTCSIITDATFVPERIENIQQTDDADHYSAFVCNENYVLAYADNLCLEYNVHRMDRDTYFYYFNISIVKGEGAENIMSVKLINTEENVDNSTKKIEDKVKCEQMTMGMFMQDDSEDAELEPVLWDVIEQEEDRILLVSHKCLDYRTYNDGKGSTTWCESEIRKWLNGDFFNGTFTEEEKQKILLTEVSDCENSEKSEDYIFLLSDEEYHMLERDNRKALLTKFARARYSEHLGKKYNEPYAFWWLRSRGRNAKRGYDLFHVCANGALNGMARSDSSHPDGIRPAMWIKK